jgi:catechol 2,3-dioxygenase-like lactoylglutathione lyase family enzyme
MLGSFPPVAFILTNDTAKAKIFYGETMGLKFVSQDDYALVFDAQGITLRVSSMPGHTPAPHPVFGWHVPDIAKSAAELIAAGLTFEKYPFLEQDELGIWTSPDLAVKVAFFKDPDGNVLSISEY